MDIKSRKPQGQFDFTLAVTQPFQSEDGNKFVWRLLLWLGSLVSVLWLVTMPLILKHYPALLEHNWQNMHATFGGGVPADPQVAFEIYAKMAPAGIVFFIGWMMLYAAGEAALHRKLIHGTEKPKMPLKFGREELRVLVAQLGVFALWMIAYTLSILVVAFVAAASIAVSPILGGILGVIGFIGVICIMVWVPIRFAPAAALSVLNGRQHLLAARKVTKHRFWGLFLAYLVVGVIGYAALYALSMILLVIVSGDPNTVTALSGFGQENPRVIFEAFGERLKNPLFMALGVVAMIIYAFAYTFWGLVLAGIAIYALKWWREDDPSEKFD